MLPKVAKRDKIRDDSTVCNISQHLGTPQNLRNVANRGSIQDAAATSTTAATSTAAATSTYFFFTSYFVFVLFGFQSFAECSNVQLSISEKKYRAPVTKRSRKKYDFHKPRHPQQSINVTTYLLTEATCYHETANRGEMLPRIC